MTKKKYMHITLISFVIGIMLAVQYNTVKSPADVRDTRDIWEIRQELSEEKKRHSELLTNIRSLHDMVSKYEDAEFSNPEILLRETVDELQRQAGLLPVEGPGLTLSIKPAEELLLYGYEIGTIPPELLFRLVNDIYRHNGQFIEIDGQRLLHTSAIRDINGETTINGIPISNNNVEVKIITPSIELANKLYNHLLASSFMDEFYIDNFELIVNDVQSKITILESTNTLTNTYLVEKNKGD